MMHYRKNEDGVTLIELVLSIGIASILTMVMIMITVYFYGDILKNQANAELALESQTIIRKIVDDARLADAIKSSNQITDANAPVGGWVTNDPSDILIIATPAYDENRNIIYDATDGYPYENETIYFKSNNVFYRRTLKNTAAPNNIAVTSCPAAAVSPSCPQDVALSTNLQNLSFTFYDINNATTSDATQARSISVSINVQKKIYGTTLSFNNATRTTLRNY